MKQLIKPGKMLKNGAITIATKGDYVFAVWEKCESFEYVSWALSTDNDTCWGHYYGSNFNEAAKAFQDRVAGK